MRLLYFVQYFPPEKASGLPIVMDMLEGFATHGWQVEVYTPTPTRGVSDEVRAELSEHKREVRMDGRLVIHRMPLYREKTSFLQRTIRYCIFSLQCLFKGLFCPADAIFTGGGPPTQGIIAGLIHKWTGKKVFFNPQDLFPDSMIVAGKIGETSAVARLGRRMERFSYRNADLIITITEQMAAHIRSKTDCPEKVHVVRNWVDTGAIRPIPREENNLFRELNLSQDKFYVTYAGNIGMVQGLDTVIEAASLLRDEPGIEFVLFGNGSEEEHIRTMIAEKQITNVRLYPLQPVERVPEVYSLGEVSLITCRAGAGNAAMPSKTYTILAAGTAVLGSFDVNSELDQTLHQAACGFCVEPENPAALADAVRHLYADRTHTAVLGRNARTYAEQYISKEKAVDEYIRLMEAAVQA